MNTSIFGRQQDIFFMEQALQQADAAFKLGEVPIGAVVVNQYGKIVAQAHNLVEHEHSQRGHAEMLALDAAGKAQKNWRLDWHWLYVTLEPCSMCMAMIKLSRVSGIVYAAASPIYGYRLDNTKQSWVYNDEMLVMVTGVKEEESVELMQKFFQQQRLGQP